MVDSVLHRPSPRILAHRTGADTVLFPVPAQPLRDLVAHNGLGFTDVVVLAGIPSTTLTRLWKDQEWAMRATGAALHQLLPIVPGVADYLTGRGFTIAVQRHLRVLASAGVKARLPPAIPAEQIAAVENAFGIAAALLDGDRSAVHRRLSSGWGLGHDVFVDSVFAPGGLLGGSQQLMSAAAELRNSGHEDASVAGTVGGAVLKHKLVKYGHLEEVGSREPPPDVPSAFLHRSVTIADILRDNDLDLARRHQDDVAHNPVLARTEQWALSSFGSGRRLPKDFSLPPVTISVHEAIVRDMATLNEAYLTYASRVAVPMIYLLDSGTGAVRARLRAAIEQRLSEGISDSGLRRDLEVLRRKLEC